MFFFFFFFNPNSFPVTCEVLNTKHGRIWNAAQWICHTCLLQPEFTPFHSFAHINLVGWCILDPFKHFEYGPVYNTTQALLPDVGCVCVFFYLHLLEKRLKWLSSLTLSVKTAIFTRLKSFLKACDKSCSVRHKSHCQKRPLRLSFPLYRRPPWSPSS